MTHVLLTEDNRIPEIEAGLVAELGKDGPPRGNDAGAWYAVINAGYNATERAFGDTREEALEKVIEAWNTATTNRMKAKQHRKEDYEQNFGITFADISTVE